MFLPPKVQLPPAIHAISFLSFSSASTPPAQATDSDSLGLLLQQCTTTRQAKQVHALILLSGHHLLSPFLSSRLIFTYSRLHLLPDAISIFFSAASVPSSLLCNSIIRALLVHCRPLAAVSLYCRARTLGSVPDSFTFPLAIRSCASLEVPTLCTSVHAHAVTMGLHTHLHVANELIAMYARLNRMELARTVFDAMPPRTVVTWNVLVSGHARNRQCDAARKVFDFMRSAGPRPNPVTWTSLLSAYSQCQRHDEVLEHFNKFRKSGCEATAEAIAIALSVSPYASCSGLSKGKEIHGLAKKSGFQGFPFVRNSLLCMYGKLGYRNDAESLFSDAEVKDLVCWNALISSYAAAGRCQEAYEAFLRLEQAGKPTPNVVSWSALIGGFQYSGALEQSLDHFRLMQRAGVQSNAVTIATVLSACAELSSLCSGREIHAHAIRSFMDGNILIQNGLLNLYIKSGSLNYGCQVFERIKDKDLITWNSMINGLGMHGSCDEALSAFYCMVGSGLEPDEITFVAILSACSHAGRVTDGQKIFDLMMHQHGISPGMEHYSCMVDLLGRAGLIREASKLVGMMPMRPNACVWGALLNSCRLYENSIMAEYTATRILGFEGETTGNCMLVSNVYAAIGRWKESARLRALTKERGMRKIPGQSWIEVNKKVHVFSAGGYLPRGSEEAFGILVELNRQMESENQLPSFLLLLYGSDEEGYICEASSF